MLSEASGPKLSSLSKEQLSGLKLGDWRNPLGSPPSPFGPLTQTVISIFQLLSAQSNSKLSSHF